MMTYRGRTVLLLSTSLLHCLGKRIGPSSNVERVPALYNISRSQHYSKLLLKPSPIISRLRRTYAQKIVSRPKGRAGKSSTAAKKAPTTSATKAAKKPAPKKTTPKAVPKAKLKAKPAKKKTKAKAKAKPKKPKKVLTPEQKAKATIKELKKTALKPPHSKTPSAWSVYLGEKAQGAGKGPKGVTTAAKEASATFKELTPEQVEHYNHIANQNRAANAMAYRQWIESHTPKVIHQANLARLNLKKLGYKFKYSRLHDDRQVKGRVTPYFYFNQERQRSGDFKGLKVQEATKLIAREWKGLTDSEKKPYIDMGARDLERYTQERKTVLDLDVRPRSSKKSKA